MQQQYSHCIYSNMNTLYLVCFGLCLYYAVEAVPLKEESKFCEEELKCIHDLNLDKNYIESIITDETSRFLPEDNTKFNEYLHCYWQARDFQGEDGTIKFENILESIQDFPRKYFGGKSDDDSTIGHEIASLAIQHCKDTPKGVSYGQTAAKLQNCIDKHMIELVEKSN